MLFSFFAMDKYYHGHSRAPLFLVLICPSVSLSHCLHLCLVEFSLVSLCPPVSLHYPSSLSVTLSVSCFSSVSSFRALNPFFCNVCVLPCIWVLPHHAPPDKYCIQYMKFRWRSRKCRVLTASQWSESRSVLWWTPNRGPHRDWNIRISFMCILTFSNTIQLSSHK